MEIFLGQRTTDNRLCPLIAHCQLFIFSFQFSILFGRSGYRRRAFRSIFARSANASLAKDAAAIPNAPCKKKSRSFYSSPLVETSPLWRLIKQNNLAWIQTRLFSVK